MKLNLAGLAVTACLFAVASPCFADETLATGKGFSVKKSEVEKLVRSELIDLENTRYQLMRGGLDGLIGQKLVELEAKERGVDAEALLKEEVEAKIAEPPEDEINKVYEANKAELGGVELEAVKDRIVSFLKQRQAQEVHGEYIASLRDKYGVKVSLEAPTYEVGLGDLPPRGAKDAKITIVGFSDYECPYCRVAEETIKKVLDEYGDSVRYVHRDFPLEFHQNARAAAGAARCAAAQGKFWEYHDRLFAAGPLNDEKYKELADELEIEREAFDACVDAKSYLAGLDGDIEAASNVGVTGTPAFFVNGRMLSGAQPFEAFKDIIEGELAD